MEQKELNFSIAMRMAELAQEVFEKLPIPVGSYTVNQVWEWASEHRPKDEVMVEVEVGSFRCSMPEYHLFSALHEFEKLAGITQKKKERFIKTEERDADFSVTITVPREAVQLAKIKGDVLRQPCNDVYIDLKRNAAVATDGHILLEYPVSIAKRSGDYPFEGIAIGKKVWAKAACTSIRIEAGKGKNEEDVEVWSGTLTCENGNVYAVDDIGRGFYRYAKVYPLLSEGGHLKLEAKELKAVKRLLTDAKKNRELRENGVLFSVKQGSGQMNISYCDDLGRRSDLTVKLETDASCSMNIMLNAEYVLQVKHWNGGMWLRGSGESCVLDDSYATCALLMSMCLPEGVEYTAIKPGNINVCERNKKPSIQPEEERASIIIMENDSSKLYKPEVRYAIEDLAAGNYKVKEGAHNEELNRAIQNMAYFALGKADLQIKVQDRFKEEFGDGHTNPDFYKLFPLPELELARLFMEVYQAEGIEEVPDCPAMEKDRQEEQPRCVSMPATEPPFEMKADVKVTSNEREIIPILELETSEGVMVVAGESYLSKLYDAERGCFFSPEAETKFNEIDAFISDEIVLARPLDLETIGEAVEEFMMEVERVS